ncbi:MAG: lactate utilization protein [Myxococcales bacterium]|nr:lactate utilization protein [Myxococcales bacterium]
MSARDELLRALRQRELPVPPLPSLEGPWIRYPDAVAQFTTALGNVGGRVVRVASEDEARAEIAALPALAGAQRVLSFVPGFALKGPAAGPDPHALEDVDLTIVRGQLGVAENGAIWVTGLEGRLQAGLFICQHLAVILDAASLVHNMHEAYARIGTFGPGFGLFLAGPSKTADIEQSLVIGAHGARSAHVFLVG